MTDEPLGIADEPSGETGCKWSKSNQSILFFSGFQANITIQIPKEHHRYVIGKEGKKLRELEQITMTKITIPNSEENSDYIKIIGPKEGIDQARHELQLISDEQVNMSFAVTNQNKKILGPLHTMW